MTHPAKSSNTGSMIWYVGLGLVLVLGIVAVIAARGSGDDDVSEEVQQLQTGEVVVGDEAAETTTDPLPAYDPEAADDPAIGQTIPTVSGTSLDGEPMTIGAGDGTAKLILFVAHWCPHCQREVPAIVEHLADTPMPDDVELLTVSTSVTEDRGNYPPSEWLEDEGWTAPVLADSDDFAAAEAYGLSAFPYFVVTDADGAVVARTSGEISMDQFDALVEAAQTGTPIS